MESREFSRQSSDPIVVDEAFFQSRSRGCCCFFPCFERHGNSSSPSPSPAVVGLTWWQKIRAVSETGSSNSLWARGVGALKKIREWSEIVAGPRWKTFIRRFNRNRSGGGGSRHVNFQYDPLSYAMNFDEGPGQNGHFVDGEEEDGYYSRNFSSRYAKGSMDLGKDGPTFV